MTSAGTGTFGHWSGTFLFQSVWISSWLLDVMFLSISSYGIHPQLIITCRVPATCGESKEDKKQMIVRMDFKVHSVSVLYRGKGKVTIKTAVW